MLTTVTHSTKFATPAKPATADLALLQNQLNTYLALEAGVRVRREKELVVVLFLMATIASLNQTLAHCWVASRDRSSSSSSRSLEFNKRRASSLVRQGQWNIN